jgi:hypothetical protein
LHIFILKEDDTFCKGRLLLIAIVILANDGATTESCRVASTNPVNIYGLLGILRYVRAGLSARPFKISFKANYFLHFPKTLFYRERDIGNLFAVIISIMHAKVI